MSYFVAACRACAAAGLLTFLSLGATPLTDAYVLVEEERRRMQSRQTERRFPLDVAFCPSCSLVQILHTVPPAEMFEEYYYYSSLSQTFLEHSREHVQELVAARALGRDSLVVELASNDGYLLRNFVEAGIPVLGVDPARGPAQVAEEIGVTTLVEFFGTEVADRLAAEGKRADVVIAKNVLAHVPDLNGFVAGIATILKDDGVAEIEVPYLRDLIENLEFDTIYHEHLSYFSVIALAALFLRHGLYLNRVRHFPIHGGSLRLTVGKYEDRDDSVEKYLENEATIGMNSLYYYMGFADRVVRLRYELRNMLEEIKSAGGRIAAYGAAAKGTVLLNSSGIGTDLIDFVVDKSPHKQGKLLPGVHVPIVPPDHLEREKPGHLLLLAWNFAEEIMREQAAYLEAGGRFIIPIPRPVIVGKKDLSFQLTR